MEETKKSSFQFEGFQIIKSHIEKIGFEKVSNNIELNFNPRGEKDDPEKTFRLFLGINIADKEKTFIANIEAVGFFKYLIETEESLLTNFFYVNAPAILFPYLRAYISTLTTLSGFETITLPTINFTFLGNTLKEHTKEIHSDPKLELE